MSGAAVTKAERDELLAKWDRAVAAHRAYWKALDSRSLTTAIRNDSSDSAARFINSTGVNGPDSVAIGG